MNVHVARTRTRAAETPASPRRFRHPADGTWHVQLTLGETYVTSEPDEVLTTVLGSCVAACICDPYAGVGGMNHFMLPGSDGADRNALCYGVNAMELLINGLMQRGGQRERFEAKLFGGANVLPGLSAIGSRNAQFAKGFLADERIMLVGGDLGGVLPRKIEYWPLTGRARQMSVGDKKEDVIRLETERSQRKPVEPASGSEDVELF